MTEQAAEQLVDLLPRYGIAVLDRPAAVAIFQYAHAIDFEQLLTAVQGGERVEAYCERTAGVENQGADSADCRRTLDVVNQCREWGDCERTTGVDIEGAE